MLFGVRSVLTSEKGCIPHDGVRQSAMPENRAAGRRQVTHRWVRWALTERSVRRMRHHAFMAVRLRYRFDRFREVNFPDSENVQFTAQDFPDGRIEVTQNHKGNAGANTVVATYSTRDVEVIDHGWPTDR